jgi:hypothetical protein
MRKSELRDQVIHLNGIIRHLERENQALRDLLARSSLPRMGRGC